MKHNFVWVYIIITFTYKSDVLELEILDWNIRNLDTAVCPAQIYSMFSSSHAFLF